MTKDWARLKLLYVGNAHPADRFIAGECGCIFHVKELDKLYEGTNQNSYTTEFFQCSACHETAIIRASPEPKRPIKYNYMFDALLVATYKLNVVQDGEGVRWH